MQTACNVRGERWVVCFYIVSTCQPVGVYIQDHFHQCWAHSGSSDIPCRAANPRKKTKAYLRTTYTPNIIMCVYVYVCVVCVCVCVCAVCVHVCVRMYVCGCMRVFVCAIIHACSRRLFTYCRMYGITCFYRIPYGCKRQVSDTVCFASEVEPSITPMYL